MDHLTRTYDTHRLSATRLWQSWLLLAIGMTPAWASEPSVRSAADGAHQTAEAFLRQHCLDCHGAAQAKAGLRLDQLSFDLTAASVAQQWREVIDRINAGEMPPEGKPRPDVKQAHSVVEWAEAELTRVERAARESGGRALMRRLNRDELANTVRDLLQLDENIVRPLMEELPADGQAEGFDRLGAALFFDQAQIERTLEVAARLADRAIVTEPPKTNRLVNRFEQLRRRPPLDMVEVFPAFSHTIPRGARDRIVRPEVIEHIQGYPTYRRQYDGWGVIDHFSIAKVVTQDGYYRIRIHATVDNRDRQETNRFLLQYAMDSPIQSETEVALDPSGVTEATVFLRGPVNGEVKGPQVFRLLWNHTEKSVIREPKYQAVVSQWTRLRSQLERAAARRAPQDEVDALLAERARVEQTLNSWQGPANIYNPEMDVERLPRLLIEAIEIEGPIEPEWPPASHRALLFDGDQRDDDAYITEIFARFLPRAYRRPVSDAEVERIASFVRDTRRDDELSWHDALRAGLERVLASPDLLFLAERDDSTASDPPAGSQLLDDYALASRLSYFLWSTMPDETLFDLAAQGKLHERAVLATQVDRMLADSKSQQFVHNFAGQWLSVRQYGSVQPAAEYRDYDPALEQASKQEPYAFFAEVLRDNLPITSFLDSDFVVINERLARHYGIDGVTGAEFRRVAVRPEHHRGGVLGMAGLMTYLADGTRTLPMRRGSWVLGELFNDPPNNPPPNAGEIQPNTAGQNLTVRQRLELHRSDAICASCHTKLDPYGLALENYDAIGKWRERFNGEGFRGSTAPLLDVSGTLPDGRSFRTLEEYKASLIEDKKRFARALSMKMLTYALGRPLEYADRQDVNRLVETLADNDYRLQSLVHAIVASTPFRAK